MGSAVCKPPRINQAVRHFSLHIAKQQSLERAIPFSFSIDQLSEITMYKDFPLQVVRACNSLSLFCITLITTLSHHLLSYYFCLSPPTLHPSTDFQSIPSGNKFSVQETSIPVHPP